ncbi:RsmB/NOP family class I SAM-dependent RNA methyltransferase [Ancylobacter dichloromethanicus]|uniref:RsmB/NOP family class I SAM-dependent RNA methyltransferase n=1 Tax=Ancylobacter dichloromethanicus TaxID=518825 RepID=UPI001BCCC98F|nr:RsmB/NOP family class I SAM-dependent RNA methyltransferase [Ancylobacter dichloromethanicus]MBS7555530.1 RsmB/NOP family class I SAM-dependent RNA methyltransferase [Ancylobacter dichloromethanicus]
MKDTRPSPRSPSPPDVPGLAARRAAADAVEAVLQSGHPLEETLERLTRGLEERDRGLARMIAATTLRRLGGLRGLLRALLERGIPDKARRVEILLLVGAAQILFMDVPDHAAVGTTVSLVGEQASTAGFKGLANAVLRRIAREGRALLPDVADQPEWLVEGWTAAYGPTLGEAVARALAREAPLDLTAKGDAAALAEKLGGRLLPTGSIRLVEAGNVTALAGFNEGEWWVQDAAAALPALLLHPAAGMTIADLCAAPGGKTAQLAAAGARVVAVDRSAPRLRRLKANMARLNLAVDIVEADATRLKAGPFDAVLIDAPCSATGTIRRHPEVAWTKAPADIASLAALQTRLLAHAADLVKPGGVLVYSTCSLEPEEGERQVEAFLNAHPDFSRLPVTPGECGIAAEWINAAGEVRTLPTHLPDEDPRFAGLDGFFAARLKKA